LHEPVASADRRPPDLGYLELPSSVVVRALAGAGCNDCRALATYPVALSSSGDIELRLDRR
jgi:hypothetical protein